MASDDRIPVHQMKWRETNVPGNLYWRGSCERDRYAQFLVEQGIDSISLNPDTVLKSSLAILEKEHAGNAQGGSS